MTVTTVATGTGSVSVAAGFYFPYPSSRPLQVPITNTAGDWVFAVVAWRPSVTGNGASVCVADDAHNWWEPRGAPSADSGAAGAVRTAVWAAPAARVANSVTGQTIVQVAATGPVLSLAVTIVDMSGILPWFTVAVITGNFANAATSLALSAAAPSAHALLFAAFASDNNSDTITGPSGWTALTGSSASNGADHTADVTLTPAYQVTSSSSTASVSSSGSLDLAGVIAGVLVSAPQPAQPSPNWPVTITEAAIGAGVTTPPSQLTWTDISARALSLQVKQGRQYALSQLAAGQGTIVLDDPDGALIPPGTGSFAGIDSGTPLRRRLIIPGQASPHNVTFNGFFRRWPWQMDSDTLRGKTQAEIADVWGYAAGTLDSMAIEEALIDQPYALWPLTDAAGSSGGSNRAPGNSLPLQQVSSKYGAGGATAVFGASTGTLPGAAAARVSSSGSSGGGGMWQQTLAGESSAVNGFGYCLACTDPNYPPVTGGVTAEVFTQWNGPDTPIGSISFSAAVSGSTISTSTSIPAGSAVVFSVASGFTFPTGITAGTVYYVLGNGGTSFQVSTVYGGTAAVITVAGSGWVQEFIPWDPVILSLRDAKAVPVVEIDIRNTDGALLIAQRTGATTRAVTVISSAGQDYRVGGPYHVSLAVTPTTFRVLVNGGSLLSATGTFSPALPASFREVTYGGIQDTSAHGWAFPGSFGFAGVYPGFSPQQRVINRYWAAAGMNGEAACDRIERILEYASLTGRRWLGQQVVTYEGDLCATGQDIGGQAAASSAGNIAQSTLPAMLAIAPTGDIFYLSKLYAWNQPVRWVLGDNTAGGEIPFKTGQFATDYDPTRVVEDVQLTQLDTQSVTIPAGVMSATNMAAVTQASASQYGGQPYQNTAYLEFDWSSAYTAGSSLQDLANWLANAYGKPANRVQAITVDAAAYPAAFPFFAAAAAGDMVQVNVRPPTAPAGPPLISLFARITQTQRNSEFSNGKTTAAIACTLDFAPEYQALVCDDPVRGLLNGVNRLAWLRLRPAALGSGTSGRAAAAVRTRAAARSHRGSACGGGRHGIPPAPPRCVCRIRACPNGRRLMPQATVPNPRTWAMFDLPTVPRLRADAVDAVAFLVQRPYFVGQSDTGASLATATYTPLFLDIELTDAWGGHLVPSTGGTDGGYFAPVPGWYLADARAPFAYNSATPASFLAGFQGKTSGAAFGNNGALAVNGSSSGTTARAIDLIEQVNTSGPGGSGDYIQAYARQDSGGSVPLQTLAADLPTVSVRWVCATSGTQPLPVPPLTTVPNPITSAWLNSNVRDTIRFLTYPPVARAYYAPGSTSLPSSSTPSVITLNTVTVDTYGGLTTGASAKYTVPVSGRYVVAGQFNLAASSTAAAYTCGLLVNGTTTYMGAMVRFAGSGVAGGASVAKRLRLTAGNTVQLVGSQNSGSSIAYNTGAANQTRLVVVFEGA